MDLSNNYAVRQFVGEFFENLAAEIFDAKALPARSFTKGEVDPDLSCDKLDAWLEIKATQEGRYFKVYVSQIQKYRELLAPPCFPHSRLWYVFFTHEVFQISKTYAGKTVQDLGQDLVFHTTRIVSLDFSIVDALSRKLKVLKEWTEFGFPPFLKWDHSINQRFLENPKNELIRFGLEPRLYAIKKSMILLKHNGTSRQTPIVLLVKK